MKKAVVAVVFFIIQLLFFYFDVVSWILLSFPVFGRKLNLYHIMSYHKT